MKPNSLIFLAAALLSGCETAIDLPEPPHTPRVALLYTLTNAPLDSSFQELFRQRQLFISKSQRVFDSGELLGSVGATAELRDASGQVVETYRPAPNFNYYGAGYYLPERGFRPRPGQPYTLRAKLFDTETAESTVTLPAPAVVESGSYVARAPDPNSPDSYQGRLNLVLRDDPAAANYYMAYARVLDQQGQPGPWSTVQVSYDSQGNELNIGQLQLSSPQQQYSLYPFADTGLNGQPVSLVSDVRFYCYGGGGFPGSTSCPTPGYIEVTVSSITADTYNFYLSRRRYYDADGNPFAEPAPLASNVRNGYGLFGGATDVTYRIPL